jgi:hypothetical protein
MEFRPHRDEGPELTIEVMDENGVIHEVQHDELPTHDDGGIFGGLIEWFISIFTRVPADSD